MTGSIYILVGADGIRYVGQTRRRPQKRYRAHIADAAAGRDLHVYRWWRGLAVPPTLVVIETCPVGRLNEREVAWIAAFRAAGARLTNLTTGGDTGTTVSAATRARLSASLAGRPSPTKGMTMTAETRAKLSAQRKGRAKSDAHLSSIGRALRASDKAAAQRAALAAGQVGRKRSPEARARMAAAQQARYASMTAAERQALTLAARKASGRA